MRPAWVAALVLGLSGPALARDFSLGVHAGAAGALGPGRSAAAMELQALVPVTGSFAFSATAGGWTFGQAGALGARTELALAAHAAYRYGLSESLGLWLAAGPAVVVGDEFGQPFALRAGLSVAPSLELATRRRTLSFQAGLRGLVFGDGLRAGLGAGVLYRFD
jgi:hypothetical protein